MRKDVVFTKSRPNRVINEIAKQGLKKVWLVGGAELTASFLELQLIDEYIIFMVPVILGEGIPLFLPSVPGKKLRLIERKLYDNALARLKYRPTKKT